jgi:hypothetical protein
MILTAQEIPSLNVGYIHFTQGPIDIDDQIADIEQCSRQRGLLGHAVDGGVAGAIVTAVVGLIKNKMA